VPSKILDIANNDWGYRSLKRPKSGGKPLTLSTIYDIFRNPFYAGKMRYMGKIVDGAHEPMISWEEYLKAQSLIGFSQ
jgi:site-specific DNA recombinase